ncbi:MAG: hypothetical protein ACI8UC_001750, partial [Psychromonas sp.]
YVICIFILRHNNLLSYVFYVVIITCFKDNPNKFERPSVQAKKLIK